MSSYTPRNPAEIIIRVNGDVEQLLKLWQESTQMPDATEATEALFEKIADMKHKLEIDQKFLNRILGISNIQPDRDDQLKLRKPPAHALVSITKFLLSKTAYERFIEPHILDIRTEHYEALQAGEFRRALWIVIRGYCQALWPLAVAAWGTILALRQWVQ